MSFSLCTPLCFFWLDSSLSIKRGESQSNQDFNKGSGLLKFNTSCTISSWLHDVLSQTGMLSTYRMEFNKAGNCPWGLQDEDPYAGNASHPDTLLPMTHA